jgi:hypothetical protein
MHANTGLRTRRLILAAAMGIGLVFLGGMSHVTMHRAPAAAASTLVGGGYTANDITWG